MDDLEGGVPLEQQSLPPHALVHPGAPLAYTITAGNGPDGKSLVLVRLETVVGSLLFVLQPDDADDLGKALRANARHAKLGLTIVGNGG